MASITKFRDGWRVHLYIQGHRESRVFPTRYDASHWAHHRAIEIKLSGEHTWTPPEVGLLSIEDLRKMPEVMPGCAYGGVYFLWDYDKLAYIGQSRKVSHRIADHKRKPPAHWQRATHIKVPYPWCLAMEQLYIAAYLPYLAKETPEGPPSSAQVEALQQAVG
jgi:hypothetical protein